MNSAKLLAISIPTYNRAGYLAGLLSCIKKNLDNNSSLKKYLNVYVFDNDSNDNTSEIVKNCGIDIIYKKNTSNIQGDPNIYQAYTAPDETYIWVIGDDELLSDCAINNVIQLIEKASPALLIQSNKKDADNEYQFYNSYNEFAQIASEQSPSLLIGHSLISANIIKKVCFDKKFAKEKIATCYGHMYGIINCIYDANLKIVVISNNDLIIREQGAPFHDGFPKNIMTLQKDYLYWLKNKYNLENLDVEQIFVKPKLSIWNKIIREVDRMKNKIRKRANV